MATEKSSKRNSLQTQSMATPTSSLKVRATTAHITRQETGGSSHFRFDDANLFITNY